jgi:hypothetical protein
MNLLFQPINSKYFHELIPISLLISFPLSPFHSVQLISALTKISFHLTILQFCDLSSSQKTFLLRNSDLQENCREAIRDNSSGQVSARKSTDMEKPVL